MTHVIEYPNNRVYNVEPLEVGVYEQEWLSNLKKEIEQYSDVPINLLINCTWIHMGEDVLKFICDTAKDPQNCLIWWVGSVDGIEFIKHQHSYKYLELLGYKHTWVGNAYDHFHTWYPRWIIKDNDLTLVDLIEPTYLFLSYNRKPRPWREDLVKKLISHGLHLKGFITFEEGVFPEIDNMSKNHDQHLHTQDRRFSRPEDITTLGSLDIWNHSYSVIVSETEISDSWQISEKTWKPIMGLRPFFLNSNKGIIYILEKLGFYTPAMLFDNPKLNDCFIEDIIEQLKAIENPMELYNKQLDMLKHNQKRFIEIANSDPTKILNWPHSVPVAG